jgi:hypothetical protein
VHHWFKRRIGGNETYDDDDDDDKDSQVRKVRS